MDRHCERCWQLAQKSAADDGGNRDGYYRSNLLFYDEKWKADDLEREFKVDHYHSLTQHAKEES